MMTKRFILTVLLCALFVHSYAGYKYTIKPNPGTGGRVTVATTDNTTFTLTATPDEGWEFTKWSDGSTTNPRTGVTPAGEKQTLYAVFTDKRCSLYGAKITNPDAGGTVTATKVCECQWTLTATADEANGYRFYW